MIWWVQNSILFYMKKVNREIDDGNQNIELNIKI